MENWLEQLHDVDPLKRKRAISALAKSLAIKEVGSLEQLAQHDPDVSVRNLAAKAIQHINSRSPKNLPIKPEPAFLEGILQGEVSPSSQIKNSNSWIVEFTIYCIVNLVGGILVCVLTLPRLATAFSSIRAAYPQYTLQRDIRIIVDGLLETTTVQLMILGIVFGLASIAVSFLMLRFTHLGAVHLLGGKNTFKGMLHQTLPTQTIMSVITIVTYVFVASINPLFIFSLGDDLLKVVVTLIGSGVYIGTYIWLARLLGRAYQFSTNRGCLSIVIAVIIIAILSVVLNLISYFA